MLRPGKEQRVQRTRRLQDDLEITFFPSSGGLPLPKNAVEPVTCFRR